MTPGQYQHVNAHHKSEAGHLAIFQQPAAFDEAKWKILNHFTFHRLQ
jgi:hypothetical protein